MTPDNRFEQPPQADNLETVLEDIYSHGGEPLDLVPAIQGEPIDREASARYTEIKESTSNGVFGRPPGIFPLEAVRQALITEKFFATVAAAVKKSDSLDYFSWLTRGILDNTVRDMLTLKQEDYTGKISAVPYGVRRLISKSALLLHDFCDNNPDLEAEAIDVWREGVDRLHGLATVAQGMRSRLSEATAQSASGKRRRLRIARMDKVLEPAETEQRWIRGTIPAFAGSKAARVQLSGLELAPIGRLDLADLESFHDQLLSGEFKAPQPLQLIAHSLNATINFIHSLRRENEAANFMQLKNRKSLIVIDNLLQKRQASDATIGYADIIKVANLITPQLQAEYELEQLDHRTIEDYPKAVDRLLLLALAKGKGSDESVKSKDKRELFAAAAACIKLLAFQGVENKLQQRELTLGDVLLRYRGLKKEDADNLLEQVRMGSSEVAVQGLYRHLRTGRSKRHANYRKFDSGYGFLS
jgi:hypothetical protein